MRSALAGIDEIAGIESGDERADRAHAVVIPRDGAAILDAVNERVAKTGLAVDQLYVERGRLEDVFREITIGETAQ